MSLSAGLFCLKRHRDRYILKGPVVLVLLWNCLLWIILESLSERDQFSATLNTDAPISENPIDYITHLLLSMLWIAIAFLSTWLVGWKYKLHDLIIVGLVVTSLGILLDNIFQLPATATGADENVMWVKALHTISYAIVSIGSAPVVTNMLQLAIEQVPDASTNQMSSLVSWFLFSITLGSWLTQFAFEAFKNCITQSDGRTNDYLPCFKIIFAILMTVLMCSNFLSKQRLSDCTPTSNLIRQIYHVLKYSLNNKSPKNRSALTYWENELPSRLNLGKRKYGGPFSNEQVEDVKTFIRITMFSGITFLFLLSVYLNDFSILYYTYKTDEHAGWHKHHVNFTHYPTSCRNSLILHFTSSTTWWQLIFILFYELILAPVFAYRLPKMQHRMGFAGGAAILLCTFITVVNAMDSFGCQPECTITINYTGLMTAIALCMGFINTLFYISGLEFICSQAPYAMRNFFISLGWCIIKLSSVVAGFIYSILSSKCKKEYCPTVYTLITLALSITGLVLLFIAIRKYQNRTRGHEDEYQQRWVEETYDKYLDDSIKYKETYLFTAK